MPLIDLKQLNELRQEAKIGKSFVDSSCFNNKGTKLDAAMFVTLLKTEHQATNLYKRLKELHQICVDYASGDFQKYIDEHEEDAEESEVYNPFDRLTYPFEDGSVYSLPRRIEQYQELCTLAANFTEMRAKRREGFDRFLAPLIPKYYLGENQEGEIVTIPETELPQVFLDQQQYDSNIRDIQTEYCLDGYNRFYETTRGLIESYRRQADAQTCALKILQLFKPA